MLEFHPPEDYPHVAVPYDNFRVRLEENLNLLG